MNSTPSALSAYWDSLESRQLFSVPAGVIQMVHPSESPALHVSLRVSTGGVTIHATAAQAFSGIIGSIRHLSHVAQDLSNVQASVDWGDGTADSASLTRNANGSITLNGSHTWAAAGTYKITVNLTRTPINNTGGPNKFFPIRVATIRSIANVAGTTDSSVGGVTFTATATQSFTQRLGGFKFANVDLLLTPHIDWGDGSTSVGTLDGGLLNGNVYSVIGTHTYAQTGQYTIHVVVYSSMIGFPGQPVPVAVTSQFIGYVAQFDSIANVMGAA